MKHKHSILLFILINVLLFQSCVKVHVTDGSPDETYHLSFSRHALDYVRLTAGKYFIYKDSVSSLNDSVVVTESKLESIFVPKVKLTFDYTTWDETPAHYYEKYSLVLTKFAGNTAAVWFSGEAETAFDKPYRSSDTAAVDFYGTYPYSLKAFQLSETSPPGNSITVEGRTYNDVIITTVATTGYYDKFVYYWAYGVGLIKWQNFLQGNPTKTFTLLRNN